MRDALRNFWREWGPWLISVLFWGLVLGYISYLVGRFHLY